MKLKSINIAGGQRCGCPQLFRGCPQLFALENNSEIMRFHFTQDSLYESLPNYYHPIGIRLALGLRDYDLDPIYTNLHIFICLAGNSRSLCRDEKRNFKTLPKVRITKATGCLSYTYLSGISLEEASDKVTMKIVDFTRKEMLQQLKTLPEHFGDRVDLDWSPFLKIIDRILSSPFKSKGEIEYEDKLLRTLESQGDDIWQYSDHSDPRYHRKSLKLLSEPFFWETGSVFSPHGSDLGVQILEDFFESSNGSMKFNSEKFLKETLEGIGVDKIPEVKISRNIKASYNADTALYCNVNNIVIAVVLADIKLKGKTSKHLAQLGVSACERMRKPFVETSLLKGFWNTLERNYGKTQLVFDKLT